MQHVPRKRFGQHFLHDDQVISHLVAVIAPTPEQHLVEIGPGRGALTFPLLKKTQSLDVIELDRDLIPILIEQGKKHGCLHVHECDALKFDFGCLARGNKSLRIVGNLPYNISTPLIFHLLTYAKVIIDMHFMLQKEVVDRLAAKVSESDYGRLSVMTQYHCAVTSLFDVPPTAFSPPPKVNSSIVRLVPHQTLPFVAQDYQHFAQLVKQVFGQRRKTVRNSLKGLVQDSDWVLSGINPAWRPEELGVGEYVQLSNLLITTKHP